MRLILDSVGAVMVSRSTGSSSSPVATGLMRRVALEQGRIRKYPLGLGVGT